MTRETKLEALELSRAELARLFEDLGQPAFRAAQVYNWVFHKAAASFEDMTDLPRALRAELVQALTITRPILEQTQVSPDGTRKLLFRLADGQAIESVLIPERDHLTLCASTQVGCAMGCRFCLTGAGGLIRNLTPGEIVGQVQAVQAQAAAGQTRNIVFMGMGEPLANLDSLLKALQVITDPAGLALAWRRVTVSTVGLADRMERLVQEAKVRLAISLNAPDDELRSEIMPINRRFPLAQLMETCRRLPLRAGERLTFEYVLLAGVNDSPAQAKQLVKLLGPLSGRAKVNLIPFNEHPDAPFKRPAPEAVQDFQASLLAANLTALIRRSMGADILAACGQLRGQR